MFFKSFPLHSTAAWRLAGVPGDRVGSCGGWEEDHTPGVTLRCNCRGDRKKPVDLKDTV